MGNPSKAAQGRSNRRRGAAAEVAVVNYLRANGYPDARRYLAGDGRQPGDLDWHPLIVAEVKDCAQSRWPTWQRQALAQTGPGQACMVIRRTRGVADPGRWEARVHAPTWYEAVRDGVVNVDMDDDGITTPPWDEWWAMTLAEAVADVRRCDA